ncbi:MAG TPA: type VII secretion integral membrane protein EccD [Pseudonocardiaceae bacterium]
MTTPTTVFSRVTVVAPQTRIDVALPADVAVADLLPMLLEMARERSPDGGSRHGGWCLAKLGDSPMEPSRTLAAAGVVDGDMLQLRRRSESPPPPLFDDVVDAIAVSSPDSYRPWTPRTARTLGQVAGGVALVVATVALFLAGPGLGSAITAGGAAVLAIALGGVITRVFGDAGTGVLVAAGGMPMAFVAGLYAVPGQTPDRPNLLLACTLVLVLAAAAILVLGTGVTTFVAGASAATLGAGAALFGTLVAHPAAGIAAGVVSIALALLSALPRLTIQLARLPLPQVPGSAEDLKEDTGFPDYASIERRAGLAHEYMTGMIIGSGAVTAICAVILGESGRTSGMILAVIVTLVMLLRARTYANGTQAIALLVAGMLAATGLVLGWMMRADSLTLNLWIFGTLVVLATAALIFGVVFPKRRFSPVLRRSVDVSEAILIASVLPVALAVMDLYSTIRHINIGR